MKTIQQNEKEKLMLSNCNYYDSENHDMKTSMEIFNRNIGKFNITLNRENFNLTRNKKYLQYNGNIEILEYEINNTESLLHKNKKSKLDEIMIEENEKRIKKEKEIELEKIEINEEEYKMIENYCIYKIKILSENALNKLFNTTLEPCEDLIYNYKFRFYKIFEVLSEENKIKYILQIKKYFNKKLLIKK